MTLGPEPHSDPDPQVDLWFEREEVSKRNPVGTGLGNGSSDESEGIMIKIQEKGTPTLNRSEGKI